MLKRAVDGISEKAPVLVAAMGKVRPTQLPFIVLTPINISAKVPAKSPAVTATSTLTRLPAGKVSISSWLLTLMSGCGGTPCPVPVKITSKVGLDETFVTKRKVTDLFTGNLGERVTLMSQLDPTANVIDRLPQEPGSIENSLASPIILIALITRLAVPKLLILMLASSEADMTRS